MNQPPDPRTDAFDYATIAPFTRFSDVFDKSVYACVPDEWWIGHCDVVNSTSAIDDGRYRSVNFAGAAVISAVRNTLKGRDVPFVFGGDGASFVIAPEDCAAVEKALGSVVTWVHEQLQLTLRAALLPVSAVRAAGFDLRVARYASSKAVDYAMFEGGGLVWADARTKAGDYAVPPAPPDAHPDLTGLSCRFEPIPADKGLVLSIIAVPIEGADRSAVRDALVEVLDLVDGSPAMGRPIPTQGPSLAWPPSGLRHDVCARGPLAGSYALRRFQILARTLVSLGIFRTGIRIGRFSPKTYLRDLVANADFRKFDDGLRMTVACTASTADAIEAALQRARMHELLRYGLHRQSAAVMTCISPSPTANDHIHFVDGADGGYANAARQLKGQSGLPPAR